MIKLTLDDVMIQVNVNFGKPSLALANAFCCLIFKSRATQPTRMKIEYPKSAIAILVPSGQFFSPAL